VEVDVIPPARFRDLAATRRVIRRLEGIIEEQSIEVVHCNGTPAHLYGSLAARGRGVPSVFHLHDVLATSWNKQGLVNWIAKRVPSTVTVAVSHHAAHQLRFRRNVRVIQNGIDMPSVTAGLSDPRWRRDPGALLVVWCGRLQRAKGAHVFLKAAALVHQAIPTARFLVVGGTTGTLDSEYEGELRDMCHTLSLENCLRFTGWLERPADVLSIADVVVSSSVYPEAFPLVVLEGMTLGRPVVAAGDGGPLEMIRTEETGLLTAPGDARALATAILRLLRDAPLRARLGESARAHVEAHFGLSRMMRQWESLYEELPGLIGRAGRVRDGSGGRGT
jgi:glycosyltransferase involved in cell wall biosynthesis